MLTPEDMRKLIRGVIEGRLRPTGLPMNREKSDALCREPDVLAAKKKTAPTAPAK